MSGLVKRACACVVALSAVVLAAGVTLAASATTAEVPEIDGGSVSAGLGVLAAGILLLRARRRSS